MVTVAAIVAQVVITSAVALVPFPRADVCRFHRDLAQTERRHREAMDAADRALRRSRAHDRSVN